MDAGDGLVGEAVGCIGIDDNLLTFLFPNYFELFLLFRLLFAIDADLRCSFEFSVFLLFDLRLGVVCDSR